MTTALRKCLRQSLLPACATLLLAGLAACHRPATPAALVSTPIGSVQAGLNAIRNGDFDGLMRAELPPVDYQAWRADWQKARAAEPAPSAEDRQKFADLMQKLTAPGAEERLHAQIKPALEQFHARRSQDAPMLIGILQAAGQNVVNTTAGLSASQKQAAAQALDALAAWAQRTDFSDDAKSRKAIAALCATARQLDLKTLDQARALDYTATMQKYGEAWNGLKPLLKVYGLDVDASFDSVKLETLSDDGQHARVRETFDFAGQPIVVETSLIKQGDHWYDADRLAAWHARQAAAQPAPATSAAASAPAKSTTAGVAAH